MRPNGKRFHWKITIIGIRSCTENYARGHSVQKYDHESYLSVCPKSDPYPNKTGDSWFSLATTPVTIIETTTIPTMGRAAKTLHLSEYLEIKWLHFRNSTNVSIEIIF